MDQERYAAIQEVFKQAVSLPPTRREAFLLEACRGDESLLTEVRSLLDHDRQVGGPLDTPTAGRFGSGELPAAQEIKIRDLPRQIAGFRILRIIGEGGMGIVCEAKQDRPARHVALKLLQPRHFSSRMRHRFELESEVLGRLQHPGIAQVISSGMVELSGKPCPYFAMELIDGRAITDYARISKLSVGKRLELVIQLCDAVHHAHQRGVIHRDLKPANILVTNEGQAKVLDFGISRLVDDNDDRITRQTEVDQLIGTLQYMSPEQIAAGSDIDARSDVYALGAISFELLTGSPPIDIAERPLPDAIRAIAESDRARLRNAAPALPGDLDVIHAKALALDRTRRYDSASALARDLERFLKREPVSARPLSASYQIWSFARRNPALATTTAVLAFVLVAGIGVSTMLAVRAMRAEALAADRLHTVEEERDRAFAAEQVAQSRREEAERQRNIADAVNDFLNEDLLASANPERNGRNVTVREILGLASSRIGSRFEDNPLVEAAISMTIGTSLRSLGDLDAARDAFEHACQLYESTAGTAALETLRARRAFGLSLIDAGDLEQADDMITAAHESTRRHHASRQREIGRSLIDVGLVRIAQGRYEDAEKSIADGIQTIEASDNHEADDLLEARYHLLRSIIMQGRYDKAMSVGKKLFEDQHSLLGPSHPNTLITSTELAGLHLRREENAEAIDLLEQTASIQEQTFGPSHPETIHALSNLAAASKMIGRHDAAEPIYLKLVDLCKQESLQSLNLCSTVYNNLARLYDAQERFDESEPLYLQAISRRRELLGNNHPDTCGVMENLAAMYARTGRTDEATRLIGNVLESRRQVLGDSHRETIFSMYHLGSLFAKEGKLEQAAPLLAEAAQHAKSAFKPGSPWIGKYLVELGTVQLSLNRLEAAEGTLIEAYETLQAALGKKESLTRRAANELARLFEKKNDPDKATQWKTAAAPSE